MIMPSLVLHEARIGSPRAHARAGGRVSFGQVPRTTVGVLNGSSEEGALVPAEGCTIRPWSALPRGTDGYREE